MQELSEHRLLVAAVYCQLLQYCHSMYEAGIPEQIIADLLNVFENIEQIGAEATEEEKENSNLITVWFLHESRGYAMTTGSAGGMSRPLWGIFRFRL